MGLNEEMTVSQLFKHAATTIDGKATYAVISFWFGMSVYAILCLCGIALHCTKTQNIIEISIFSISVTPIFYVASAYFSVGGKKSEVVNAVTILAMNFYLFYTKL